MVYPVKVEKNPNLRVYLLKRKSNPNPAHYTKFDKYIENRIQIRIGLKLVILLPCLYPCGTDIPEYIMIYTDSIG